MREILQTPGSPEARSVRESWRMMVRLVEDSQIYVTEPRASQRLDDGAPAPCKRKEGTCQKIDMMR